MSDELALAPKTLDEAKSLSTTLSKASLLPEALRGKEADVLMTIMTGRELGLGPMQAIRAIDVIKGKPSLKAEAMVALVRARKDVCAYLKCDSSDATKATWSTQRVGDPTPTVLSWTMEQSKTAGLATSDMYRKYPDAMLRWRAASMLVKLVYSDIVLGLYTPEELTDGRADERDVTPAPAKGEAIDTTATVSAAKEAVKAKRKLNVVDVAAPAPSAPFVPDAETPEPAIGDLVGWGKHAAVALSALTDVQLDWYLSPEGQAVCAKNCGTEATESLRAKYLDEAARRETKAVAP